MSETARGERGPAELAREKARHFISVGRHELARRELESALGFEPQNPLLYFELARALLGLEDLEGAEEATRRAIELAPEWAVPYGLLGSLRMDQGRHVEAERDFLAALRLDPQAAWLYELYGRLMTRTRHFEKAEKLLRRALELDPESSGAHAALAFLMAQQNRGERARAHGRQGLGLAPDEDHSHAALASAYVRSGRPFKARRHMREALRLDPSDEDLEQGFLEIDRCCRLVYLPMYHYSLLLDRIPGKQFTVWGVFVAAYLGMRSAGVSDAIVLPVALGYAGFCIYTWLSEPLVRLWVKLFPPR